MDSGVSELWRFELTEGRNEHPRDGACIMDAISWLEYGHLGDQPECVCPAIAHYCRQLNDELPDQTRQSLKRYIPRLIGCQDWDAFPDRMDYLERQIRTVFFPLMGTRSSRNGRQIVNRMFKPQKLDWTVVAFNTGHVAIATIIRREEDLGLDPAPAYQAVWDTLDGVLALGKQGKTYDLKHARGADRSFARARALT